MTAIDWDTERPSNVSCPPYAAAVCVCGDVLANHSLSAQDVLGRDVDMWQCPEPQPTPDRTGLVPAFFDMAAGESIDCPDAGTDPVCDAELCSEHSVEFTTCVASSAVLHHWGCRNHCPSCSDAARADAVAGDLS